MSDLISREAVLEHYRVTDPQGTFAYCNSILEFVESLPSAQPEQRWIPVSERLPKEEDSIFARYYGTDSWRKSMFHKKSREVIVTSVFKDGELHTEVAHTTDGEWRVGITAVPRTVIAWMPLPEPYKEGENVSDNDN